ncbi:MAG: TetR/AcrR family transcriptional regulator [Chloroflexi bacterium]|nr:TetR/AcrR family transcriptional regulator [Chloroflexota bacterium]
MNESRRQILETTTTLLEAQGYHATGMNQIIRESGAPKGSLYYYFPDGKDGLTAEAIEHASAAVVERIHTELAVIDDPAEAIGQFITNIAFHVEASGFKTGGPLMTVALETATTNERLNLTCRAAYQRLVDAFADKLDKSGLDAKQAQELATFIVASIEGAVLLSRTYHNTSPLRMIGRQLARYISNYRQ